MGGPEIDELCEKVSYLLSKGIKKIVLDLKLVAWMNSMGVGSVIRCYTSVRKQDGELYLACITEKTNHILKITHLLNIFKIYDTVEEAIKSLNNSEK